MEGGEGVMSEADKIMKGLLENRLPPIHGNEDENQNKKCKLESITSTPFYTTYWYKNKKRKVIKITIKKKYKKRIVLEVE